MTTAITTLFTAFCQRKAMYDAQLASVKAAAWEEKEHLLILIGYVLMNMTLTLALWHFVYDMEASPLFIFFDLETQYSTGNAFLDAIINGLIVSLIVTILSLILAACIMRKMKQFVTGFIRWNILIANNLIPIQLLSDLHAKLQLESNAANGLFILVAMSYFAKGASALARGGPTTVVDPWCAQMGVHPWLFHHHRMARFQGVQKDLSWADFFTLYVTGSIYCASWFEKNNKMANRDISWFFDRKVCNFMRKGEIGDWKNYFTSARTISLMLSTRTRPRTRV